MKKSVSGSMVFLDGEEFYKIEHFDMMDDFFMTITSSSDVWNFCWAQGGITAGRKNESFSIFPYYTCDKIQDMKGVTGSLTIIKIKNEGKKGILWQPFENLFSTGASRYTEELGIIRNVYKNVNGSKVWFEEINLLAGVSFRYGWTSSAKFGLVRMCRVENLTDKKVRLTILDGSRNILPSSCDSNIQNTKSVLFDAYKKSEVETESNIALFTLSSIVTDKAEPSESLKTNISWFTTKDSVILSENAVDYFLDNKLDFLQAQKKELNGKRGQCFIIHESELVGKSAECWEQVFDVDFDASRLIALKTEISDRDKAWKLLEEDIAATNAALTEKIAQADGIQTSGNKITDLHHHTNVMFNIMRGGVFANERKLLSLPCLTRQSIVPNEKDYRVKPDNDSYGTDAISMNDFISFAKLRNHKLGEEIEKGLTSDKNPQVRRLFLEYLPLTFSRRHGDPSRPWNRFNIDLKSADGSEKINYEGNWRDIFQNWEALLWSYPEYAENMAAVFVNAMTVEGYNPYRISREGLDWEVPEEGNPWAQFGFWGDHQVIYVQKILEFLWKYNRRNLLLLMNEKAFSTANIPYRIKSYAEILKDPRNSIRFDYALDSELREKEKEFGKDARCIQNENGSLQLTTLATKLVQLILAKLLNHIPDAGIWMNMQRPEWNDANNALAGYGTSVVTMCYLERMISFLIKIAETTDTDFLVNETVAQTLKETSDIYRDFANQSANGFSNAERKIFTDKIGILFEKERKTLYESGFSGKDTAIPAQRFVQHLKIFLNAIRKSIESNRRQDGLFHSYNSIVISEKEIHIVNLKLMLEGQVAALSSTFLEKKEKRHLLEALRSSDLFEQNQHSYLLYPNSALPDFLQKNCIEEKDLHGLMNFVAKTGNSIFIKDINGAYHFNADFRNADCLANAIENLPAESRPTAHEKELLFALYEKIFHHQTFTGRSGTFYAYEGLGSIYWHMVSKLLLAVQENISAAKDCFVPFYKDIKEGLGASKTPAEYGAFPFDPYSHTPFKQGARQPGMTGQVKEEILGRWLELGLDIDDGKAVFNPTYLEKKDFDENGEIHFTWCGTKIVYTQNQTESPRISVTLKNSESRTFSTHTLGEEESRLLFARSGEIAEIRVAVG